MKATALNKLYNIHSIWLTMMVLTLTTYAMGKLEYSGMAVMLFLLSSATVKAGMVIRDFMGLRGVSLLWRVIMYGWLLVVCVSIAIAYIISI
ncbi:MAG: hypothetical protein DRQ44_04510 [Gammaproteobacteria bacterium]|nr:MAG: hypothetical protein DRQ44_04510 [Gammaproteobacteria bacterium]